MRSFLHSSPFVAAIAMVLAFSAAKTQASEIIDYSLDGGATFFTLESGPSGSMLSAGSPNLGVFAVSDIHLLSNSPGGSSLAELESASLDIQNTSGATASIEFVFSDSGFTQPAGSALHMASDIAGSVTVDNPDNLASFTSCLSATDANLTSCTGATDVDGPGFPDITASSFNNDRTLNINSLGGPYSVTEVLDLTLGAGSDVGFNADSTIESAATPTPEPATWSLILLGAFLVGFKVVRRSHA
ncbi:MAG: PEP-CTERM sorting domain-containing protein [Terracidiphilus sp.]|jgi:hypothetical protein